MRWRFGESPLRRLRRQLWQRESQGRGAVGDAVGGIRLRLFSFAKMPGFLPGHFDRLAGTDELVHIPCFVPHRLVRKETMPMRLLLPKATLLALAAVLLLPAAPQAPSGDAQPFLLVVQAAEADEQSDAQTLRVLRQGICTDEPLDTYLTQVVLSELPASFAPAAMQAQAVAARTFALRQSAGGKHPQGAVCTNSACCQACHSPDELRARLGDDFERAWQAAHSAVTQTQNEVLTYDGALIDAVYFSCSGGSTENAAAVWGADVPYLQCVASPGEQSAAPFSSSAVFSVADFRARILSLAPEAALDAAPEQWLGSCTRTQGGGVAQLTVGGCPLSGTQLRGLFSLHSTRFTLAYRDGAFRFDVLGYGHRVGMSQYGAQAIAQLGFDYRAILLYYYRGARVEALPAD